MTSLDVVRLSSAEASKHPWLGGPAAAKATKVAAQAATAEEMRLLEDEARRRAELLGPGIL